MTENQIKELGFVLEKQFNHDEFNTNRYRKGALEVDFSYEGDKLLSCDLAISEINCLPVTLEEMRAIVPVLTKDLNI